MEFLTDLLTYLLQHPFVALVVIAAFFLLMKSTGSSSGSTRSASYYTSQFSNAQDEASQRGDSVSNNFLRNVRDTTRR